MDKPEDNEEIDNEDNKMMQFQAENTENNGDD